MNHYNFQILLSLSVLMLCAKNVLPAYDESTPKVISYCLTEKSSDEPIPLQNERSLLFNIQNCDFSEAKRPITAGIDPNFPLLMDDLKQKFQLKRIPSSVFPIFGFCENQEDEKVNFLLDSGADFDRWVGGECLLTVAIRSRDDLYINQLLESGLTPDNCLKGDNGLYKNSPMRQAIMSQKVKIIKILADKGINMNTTFYDSKQTYLQLACLMNSKEIVDILLDHGANPNTVVQNPFMEIPFIVSQKQIPLIADAAILKGSSAIIKSLLRKGVDPNSPFKHEGKNATPLVFACMVNNYDTIFVLAAHGGKLGDFTIQETQCNFGSRIMYTAGNLFSYQAPFFIVILISVLLLLILVWIGVSAIKKRAVRQKY